MAEPKNWITPHLKAAGLSHLFPGIGQFYNKQPVKGTFFVVTALISIVGAVVFTAKGFAAMYGSVVSLADPSYNVDVNPIAAMAPGLLFMGTCILLFLWSIVDAWAVAKKRGRQETPVEVQKTVQQPVLPPPPPS